MNIFKKLIARVKLNRAIIMADKRFIQSGERQYVIAAGKKLFIIDRRTFKWYKKKGYINRENRVIDLELGAFYYTSYKDGTMGMDEKTQKYRRYCYLRWYAKHC